MTTPEFTVEFLDPETLVPSPANFRRHPSLQREALEASIDSWGWLAAPIINRQSGHILDGHARVELAVERGEATIPVRVVNVSEAQEKRILASFDRIGSLAERDDMALTSLLQELAESAEGLPAGWEDSDLEALLAELTPASGLVEGADPDAVPERVETRCQPGDLWILGEHRLLCGDSTKREEVERLMGGKRASLLATDPPYLVDYEGGSHPASTNNKGLPNKDKDWSAVYQEQAPAAEFYTDFLRVALEAALGRGVAVYQWYGHLRHSLVEEAWRRTGLLFHQPLVWMKNGPVLTYSHFMWQHEACAYGWKQGEQPEMKPPPSTTTIWECDGIAHQKMVHPTQKPLALFTRPIEWHTRPTEICYEPFAGSGTQIIAAEQLNRACYAMEISPEFCDVIIQRWEDCTNQKAKLQARSA